MSIARAMPRAEAEIETVGRGVRCLSLESLFQDPEKMVGHDPK